MEKNEKKLVTTIAVSFVAGVVVTLGILTFGCCPSHHKAPKMMPHHPPFIEMNMPKAHFDKGDMHGQKGDFKRHHRHHRGFKGKNFEPTPEMKERFAKKLGLTDEQKVKLDEMRKADMAKMEPLFKEMENLHQQMKELRKVNREHFESVLTDQQKEILKEMKKEHLEKRSH